MNLNSTGSYRYSNGKYWSYDTKLTDTYKGYKIFNDTYYSATTRKHQYNCKYDYSYDIALHDCSYGNWNCLEMIKREIDDLKNQLEKRKAQKRATEKKKQDIQELSAQIEFLENLIKEDSAEEKPDFFEDFKDTWDKLSEENKQHVRNGLGDNLLQTEEQARNVTGVMKMMLAFQQLGV